MDSALLPDLLCRLSAKPKLVTSISLEVKSARKIFNGILESTGDRQNRFRKAGGSYTVFYWHIMSFNFRCSNRPGYWIFKSKYIKYVK